MNAVEPRPFTVVGHGGVKIVGEEAGDPTHPPVLMLHGGGQNRLAWRKSADALVRAGYQVISYDSRGHGDSDWCPDGQYEMEHMAGDLNLVLERIQRPPAVVGASMGGMTSLWAQGQTEEQLFSSVILVDVTPRMEVSGVARIVGFMTAHPDGFGSLDDAAAAIAAYNPHRASSGGSEGLRKVLRERDGRWHWRWDPRFITSKMDLTNQSPKVVSERMAGLADILHSAARKITVPTLLVRGADSDLVSAESVREFLAVVPHASFVDVSGTGHMVAGDDNDAFTTAVLDFLHEHVPATADEAAENEARDRAAAAVRRFGHALVNHDASLDVLERITGELDRATATISGGPIRDRLAELLASGRFSASGEVLDLPITQDGDEVHFARYSLVGGPANPFGIEARYRRDGDAVVARVTLGAAFEGPPGRAHGGVISAIVDETMAALIRVIGTPAFTASLTLEYRAAAPLHAPLEFRAELTEHAGRKLEIACTGTSRGRLFVEGHATFIEVELAELVKDFGQLEDR